MLTAASFKNMGLFQNPVKLTYEKNRTEWKGVLGIHVGHNGSGKSCVAEIIRRCLSSEINYTDTGIIDTSIPAGCVCKYVATEKSLTSFKPFDPKEKSQINEYLDIIEPTDEKITITAGIVYNKYHGPRLRFLQFEKENPQCVISAAEATDFDQETGKFDNSTKRYMRHAGEVLEEEENLKLDGDIQEWLKLSSSGSRPGVLANLYQGVFRYFKQVYDTLSSALQGRIFHRPESYICPRSPAETIYASLFGSDGLVFFLFPHRGIGPMDSSRSVNMFRRDKEENYKEPPRRAEMLTSLIEKVRKQKLQDELKQHVQNVVGTDAYTFEIDRAKRRVYVKDQYTEKPTDLLKSPEGLYEAFISCALITLATDYTTIYLDEPNRCMHPDMISKLRQLFVETVRRKSVSVVLSTHAPEFISPDTWNNIYCFRRTKNEQNGVALICNQLPTKAMQKIRYFTLRNLRTMMFSRKILVVEGMTDEILITEVINQLQRDNNTSSFKYAEIQVITMQGEKQQGKVRELAEDINIPCRVLIDTDGLKPRILSLVKTKVSHIEDKLATLRLEKNLMTLTEQEKQTLAEQVEQLQEICERLGKSLKTLTEQAKQLQKICEKIRKLLNTANMEAKRLAKGTCSNFKSAVNKNNLPANILGLLEDFANETDTEIHEWKKAFKVLKDWSGSEHLEYLKEEGHLSGLIEAEALLSRTKAEPDSSHHGDTTFKWNCGEIEDMINFTLRKTVQQRQGPVFPKSSVWYCQKETDGAINHLSTDEVTEIVEMLRRDMENTDFKSFLNFLEAFVAT